MMHHLVRSGPMRTIGKAACGSATSSLTVVEAQVTCTDCRATLDTQPQVKAAWLTDLEQMCNLCGVVFSISVMHEHPGNGDWWCNDCWREAEQCS